MHDFSHIPTPIRPVYWSDSDLALYAGPLVVDYGDASKMALDGAVHFRWAPTPHVLWSATTNDHTLAFQMFEAGHRSADFPDIQICPPDVLPPVLPRRGSQRLVLPVGRGSSGGPCGHHEFGVKDARMSSVVCLLINGPRLLPLAYLRSRTAIWMGRWELRSATWNVTIDARPELDKQIAKLTETRGLSFTHTCRLTRTDGSTFSIDDADAILNDLFLFMSFVRGSLVGVALPTGFQGRTRVWTRWTTGIASSYDSNFSWADPHQSGDIASLWPLFLTERANPAWGEALLRAIRHYTDAIAATSAEGTITLAQAGLELLVTAVLVDRDRRFNPKKWDNENTPWRLRKLLRAANIDTTFPPSLLALRAAAKRHRLHDGPAALASVRNTVTHWSTTKPEVDTGTWIDTYQLALHYLELSILWALGYQGRAYDRTSRPLEHGSAALVPWATSDSGAVPTASR